MLYVKQVIIFGLFTCFTIYGVKMTDRIPPLPPENLSVEYRSRPRDHMPEFGSREYVERHGSVTFKQGIEYSAHMGCD